MRWFSNHDSHTGGRGYIGADMLSFGLRVSPQALFLGAMLITVLAGPVRPVEAQPLLAGCEPVHLLVVPMPAAGSPPTADEPDFLMNLLDTYLTSLVVFPCGDDMVFVPKINNGPGYEYADRETEGLGDKERSEGLGYVQALLDSSPLWGRDDVSALLQKAEEKFQELDPGGGARNVVLFLSFGRDPITPKPVPGTIEQVAALSVASNPDPDANDLRVFYQNSKGHSFERYTAMTALPVLFEDLLTGRLSDYSPPFLEGTLWVDVFKPTDLGNVGETTDTLLIFRDSEVAALDVEKTEKENPKVLSNISIITEGTFAIAYHMQPAEGVNESVSVKLYFTEHPYSRLSVRTLANSRGIADPGNPWWRSPVTQVVLWVILSVAILAAAVVILTNFTRFINNLKKGWRAIRRYVRNRSWHRNLPSGVKSLLKA